MSHKSFVAIIVLLTFTCKTSFGQIVLKQANKYYGEMSYDYAIPKFEKALKKNPSNEDAVRKLAICYRLTNKNKEAEIWYAKVVKQSNATEEDIYFYGYQLIINGKYDEAREYMAKAYNRSDDHRGTEYVHAIDQLKSFFVDSAKYRIKLTNINSPNSDFGVALLKDGIAFASSRPHVTFIERKHSWTGKPFLAVYYAKGDSNTFEVPEIFAKELQTKYNNGPVCLSPNGDVMYYTSNNIDHGKVLKSADQVVKLKIFISRLVENKWSDPESFPYNSNEYNCAHPNISKDGNKLYFSSDMPGTYGGMDIWVSEKDSNGAWMKPRNLDTLVNTQGHETFPFYDNNNKLYFSSDGHQGMGGLDIFYVTDSAGKYVKLRDMGYPINSSADDFGLVVDYEKKHGYYCTNRGDDHGNDEIYCYWVKEPEFKLNGIVVDSRTDQPVTQTLVRLTNKLSNRIVSFTTDSTGRFNFALSKDSSYTVIGEKDLFLTQMDSVSTLGKTESEEFYKKLVLETEPVMYVHGIVVDKETQQPISSPLLKLRRDSTDKLIGLIRVDSLGKFNTMLGTQSQFKFNTHKANYQDNTTIVSTHGMHSYDTLFVKIEMEKDKTIYFNGTIVDKVSRQPLPGSEVLLWNKTQNTYDKFIADSMGGFATTLKENCEYDIGAAKKNYLTVHDAFTTKGRPFDDPFYKNHITELDRFEVGKIFVVENLYYDYGKWNIRADAAKELDKLVKVLQENPAIKIELGSHTDARSTDKFNMDLSTKRAKSAAAYIVSKGIAAERIAGKGYGESQLKNKCKDGVKCSEAEHQENRRTEIKVTEIGDDPSIQVVNIDGNTTINDSATVAHVNITDETVKQINDSLLGERKNAWMDSVKYAPVNLPKAEVQSGVSEVQTLPPPASEPISPEVKPVSDITANLIPVDTAKVAVDSTVQSKVENVTGIVENSNVTMPVAKDSVTSNLNTSIEPVTTSSDSLTKAVIRPTEATDVKAEQTLVPVADTEVKVEQTVAPIVDTEVKNEQAIVPIVATEVKVEQASNGIDSTKIVSSVSTATSETSEDVIIPKPNANTEIAANPSVAKPTSEIDSIVNSTAKVSIDSAIFANTKPAEMNVDSAAKNSSANVSVDSSSTSTSIANVAIETDSLQKKPKSFDTEIVSTPSSRKLIEYNKALAPKDGTGSFKTIKIPSLDDSPEDMKPAANPAANAPKEGRNTFSNIKIPTLDQPESNPLDSTKTEKVEEPIVVEKKSPTVIDPPNDPAANAPKDSPSSFKKIKIPTLDDEGTSVESSQIPEVAAPATVPSAPESQGEPEAKEGQPLPALGQTLTEIKATDTTSLKIKPHPETPLIDNKPEVKVETTQNNVIVSPGKDSTLNSSGRVDTSKAGLSTDILIKGNVVNMKTKDAVSFATLHVRNVLSGKVDTINANRQGAFFGNFNQQSGYHISASKRGYLVKEKSIETKGEKVLNIDFELEKLDTATYYIIPSALHDSASIELIKTNLHDLENWSTIMQENPQMVIEIGSHTDAQEGNADKAIDFTTKRAREVAVFFINKGIGADRVNYKGYGYSKPINECKANINCDYMKHRENNRTEIKIGNTTDTKVRPSKKPELQGSPSDDGHTKW